MGNRVNGAIHTRFQSVRDFGEAMGWSYSKALRVAKMEQTPTIQEINQMARVLECPLDDLVRFFLDRG